jgi:hypothetical protein
MGAFVKTSLGKLTLIAGITVLAWPTLAQTANPSEAAPGATLKPASNLLRPLAQNVSTASAADFRTARLAPVTRTIAAAGSLIVMVDGVVVNASMAQIQPPGAGFVYEP